MRCLPETLTSQKGKTYRNKHLIQVCVKTQVTPNPNLLSSWIFTGNEDGIMALWVTTFKTMSALIFVSGGPAIKRPETDIMIFSAKPKQES